MAASMEADEQEQNGSEEPLQLCFPLPPLKYFKRYTEAEVKNNLAPSPPKIISGSYSTFGDMFETNEEIIRPLEAQGIPRLYSFDESYDILTEMKKINHSILVNFLELLDTLVESNSQHERELKLEDINLLFINLHHLINEFRPHQARETLRVMLQRQKAQKLETSEKLNRHIEKTRAILRNCYSVLATKPSPAIKHQQQQQQQSRSETGAKALENIAEQGIANKCSKQAMCDIMDQII